MGGDPRAQSFHLYRTIVLGLAYMWYFMCSGLSTGFRPLWRMHIAFFFGGFFMFNWNHFGGRQLAWHGSAWWNAFDDFHVLQLLSDVCAMLIAVPTASARAATNHALAI